MCSWGQIRSLLISTQGWIMQWWMLRRAWKNKANIWSLFSTSLPPSTLCAACVVDILCIPPFLPKGSSGYVWSQAMSIAVFSPDKCPIPGFQIVLVKGGAVSSVPSCQVSLISNLSHLFFSVWLVSFFLLSFSFNPCAALCHFNQEQTQYLNSVTWIVSPSHSHPHQCVHRAVQ